jgi:putative hydrolase of the HAD superfamily
VFDDVEETLAELLERKIPVGIASNFDDRLLHLFNVLPPLNRVHRIFHSSAVGWSKPRPEFFLKVQRQLNVDPAKILLVGDDEEKDLAGALNAGWQALLIDRSGKRRDQKTIGNLSEVFEFLN